MAIDPKTHNIYLPAAEFSLPNAPAAGEPKPRPTMIKGSFAVQVVGQQPIS